LAVCLGCGQVLCKPQTAKPDETNPENWAPQALLDTALRFSVSARLARFKAEYDAQQQPAVAGSLPK